VDDFNFVCENSEDGHWAIEKLGERFEIKNLGRMLSGYGSFTFIPAPSILLTQGFVHPQHPLIQVCPLGNQFNCILLRLFAHDSFFSSQHLRFLSVYTAERIQSTADLSPSLKPWARPQE
jgi:hypothetical protein